MENYQADEARASWTPQDILHLYHLVLNRSVEAQDILEEMSSWDERRLIGSFFHSEEFRSSVGARLKSGQTPRDASPPSQELCRWASLRMPLSDAGRERTAAAFRSWSALYHALASDPVFRDCMDHDSPLTEPRAFACLTASVEVEGRLEEVSASRVKGWAAFPDKLDTPVSVELWVNGFFCSATTTSGFRRDVQDLLGGEGLAGFEIDIPFAVRERFSRMELEVRAASNHFVLGRAVVSAELAVPDFLSAMREDLLQARRLLEQLETRLPSLETSLSVPLSDYDSYSRAWRASGPDPVVSDLEFEVVLDIVGATPGSATEAAKATVDQTHRRLRLILVASTEQKAMATDLLRRLDWTGLTTPTILVLSDGPDQTSRLKSALARSEGDLVLPLTADVVLERSALARLAALFSTSPSIHAAYFDEDVFDERDAEAAPADRRRIRPWLKPDLDPDYLLQTPYVGELVAFRRSTLQSIELRSEAEPHVFSDALLGLEPGAVGHVARVLASRVSLPIKDADAWQASTACWIAASGLEAVVERRVEDILGARTDALRVRRKPKANSACLVIPTRDGLDLLRPCVDSLLDRRADNVTPFEILIIDHDSRDAATRTYLADLESRGDARVMPYSGDFNWALMNNLAAAEAQAEVLVFLNNDTVALSRDWLDELAAQAMRPEVGAAGCRLIYGDGTIQHAGFVTREETYAFLCHEGVGEPGSEAGYLDRYAVVHATAAVTGACMAIRSELFRSLGGFDPAFPVEGNDVDLCLRARAQGLKVIYTPDATLYHLESKTRGFNHDRTRQEVAEAASRVIWRRWSEAFRRDTGFNPHFDRMSRPFSRLRPPPPWTG